MKAKFVVCVVMVIRFSTFHFISNSFTKHEQWYLYLSMWAAEVDCLIDGYRKLCVEQQNMITLWWIPSHTGIPLNEDAINAANAIAIMSKDCHLAGHFRQITQQDTGIAITQAVKPVILPNLSKDTPRAPTRYQVGDFASICSLDANLKKYS